MADVSPSLEEVIRLLEPGAESERAELDPSSLDVALLRQIDGMLSRIDLAIHHVALRSRIVADLFWEEQQEHYESKDPGTLGVRVRVNKGTLEVAYFRNAFTRKGDTKRSKSFYANHIRKSGKYRYTSRDFSGARDWERALALEHEEEHEKNRRLFAELSQARRTLRRTRKSLLSMLSEGGVLPEDEEAL